MLEVDDFLPDGVAHDILDYPIYYFALYFPDCYPDLFATPLTVKEWLESSLCSHICSCYVCRSNFNLLGMNICVQWKDPYYMICSCIDCKC